MEAILDTNFIISCIRNKIDFISQLEEEGFKVILPREVMRELKDIKRRTGESHYDKSSIELALQIFEKSKIRKMALGNNKVDEMLVRMGVAGAYIATLDKAILNKIQNRIIINSSARKIMVERD
jgi:rRNA-processing protein FCF1